MSRRSATPGGCGAAAIPQVTASDLDVVSTDLDAFWLSKRTEYGTQWKRGGVNGNQGTPVHRWPLLRTAQRWMVSVGLRGQTPPGVNRGAPYARGNLRR